MNLKDQLQLTEEDKAKYERRIAEIDLKDIPMVLQKIPELNEELQKRIVFALEYFLEEYDEIPDSSPKIGLLDDYVLVRWVVDNIMMDYSEVFEA